MDQAHPITKFLLKYGFWIRGTAFGLVLCLMLQTGFLNSEGLEPGENSNMLYFGLMAVGLFAPSVGALAFTPFWEKITPIKDRITYFEGEIVFIGSALIGVSAAFFFWVLIPPLTAVQITLWALMATSPVFFLMWLIKSTLDPLDAHDTSSQVAAAQDFRDQTPHFWNNATAYVITAVVSALVVTLTILLLSIYRGASLNVGTGCTSVISMVILNLIAAPIYIWIGGKLRPAKRNAKGSNYTIGGILILTIIVGLNVPIILKMVAGPDQILAPQSLLNAWPFAAAYLLICLSYMAGGYTLSKLYKPKPPGLKFA